MSDWVTAKEARAMCGNMSRSSFDSAVARQGWEGKWGKTSDAHPCKLWRTKDIQAYATERQRRSDNRHNTPAAVKSGVRELVKWVDSFKRWPTEEEIVARVCPGWNAKTIRMILDTRGEGARTTPPLRKLEVWYDEE